MKRWEIENRDYQAYRVSETLPLLEQKRKEKALIRAKRWLANPKNEGKKPPRHLFEKALANA